MRFFLTALRRILTGWFGSVSPMAIAVALVVGILILGVLASCATQEIQQRAIQDHSEQIIRDLICTDPTFDFLCDSK